jgi:enoyl-CoA hydratase
MMDEISEAIVNEVIGPVAIFRFNRPSQRNPLSSYTLQELSRTLSPLVNREDIKAVIFTGAEDVFASGADIRELAQLHRNTALEFARCGQDMFQAIADMAQITIAAINGYCMGGGMDLALACDIRVASRSAVFAHPGAKLGIITGWGGTQRLPQIVGRSHALELFATARRYSSGEALQMGLITRIGDPVLECALERAHAAIAVATVS